MVEIFLFFLCRMSYLIIVFRHLELLPLVDPFGHPNPHHHRSFFYTTSKKNISLALDDQIWHTMRFASHQERLNAAFGCPDG